jgi:hypothetical protein
MLGPKQGVLGPQDSVIAGVQEEMPPEEAVASEEGTPAPAPEAQEFEGVMSGIQTIQAGVQGLLESMIDMEGQTVKEPEALAGFLEDMGMLLAKYQGSPEQADPAMAAEG